MNFRSRPWKTMSQGSLLFNQILSMRPGSSTGMCILTLLFCNNVLSHKTTIGGENELHTKEYVTKRINKRALPISLAILMKEAKLVKKFGGYRLYAKKGGFSKARTDFRKLQLDNIKEEGNVLQGEMNGKVIILRPCDNGDCILDIWSMKKLQDGTVEPGWIDRVRYYNTKE